MRAALAEELSQIVEENVEFISLKVRKQIYWTDSTKNPLFQAEFSIFLIIECI